MIYCAQYYKVLFREKGASISGHLNIIRHVLIHYLITYEKKVRK